MIILRPPEEVFAFMTDLDNWAQLQPNSQEKEQPSHSLAGVGDTFRQAFESQGRQIELWCKTIDYEPNETLSFECAWNDLWFEVSITFEPAEGGTKLTGKGEANTTGPLKLFEPLVQNKIDKEVETSLDKLKVLLESRAPDNT